MVENLAIGVSLFMRDTFTAQADRASSAMIGLNNNANQLARTNAIAARNTAATGAAIGLGILSGVKSAYKGAAEFDYLIKYVGLLADEGGKHFDQLRDKANEVATHTTFNPQEVADAMKYMAQSGMQYKDIIASIASATELAQATMSDVGGKGGSADWITSLMHGWSDQIPKTEQGFKRMADVLGMATNKSKTSLQEFGEAMTYSMATATRMKMGFEETTAATMMLSNMGLRGSLGGVALNNMLMYATRAAGSKEGKKQANALHMLGLDQQSLRDAKGGLIPIGEILEKIHIGASKLKPIEAQNAIYDIFGMRGQKVLPLGNHIDTYKELVKTLKEGVGYTEKMADHMMDTPEGRIDMLADNWDVLKRTFGAALFPLIDPLITKLTNLFGVVGKFLDTPFGKMLSSVAVGFVAIKTAMYGYQAIMLTVRLMQGKLVQSAVTMAEGTVAGFSAQTAAANKYAASLTGVAAAQKMAYPVGASSPLTKNFKPDMRYAINGVNMLNTTGLNTGRMSGSIMGSPLLTRLGGGLGKIGNFLGKASLPAMLGGIALGSLADSAGGNKTGTGVGLGVAGDTLSGIGTGAMIGSIIPGIGTAIGGIVGGVGMLAYGLYTRLNELNGVVKEGADQARQHTQTDLAAVKREMDLYQKMSWSQKAWHDNSYNMSGERIHDRAGNTMHREFNKVATSIIINMDGKKVMNETYTDRNVKELVNLNLQ